MANAFTVQPKPGLPIADNAYAAAVTVSGEGGGGHLVKPSARALR
jgi:hypothetical protein